MKGYICDRCKATDPGESGNQRDPGPHKPTGWVELKMSGPGYQTLHLCADCTVEFGSWVGGGS